MFQCSNNKPYTLLQEYTRATLHYSPLGLLVRTMWSPPDRFSLSKHGNCPHDLSSATAVLIVRQSILVWAALPLSTRSQLTVVPERIHSTRCMVPRPLSVFIRYGTPRLCTKTKYCRKICTFLGERPYLSFPSNHRLRSKVQHVLAWSQASPLLTPGACLRF